MRLRSQLAAGAAVAVMAALPAATAAAWEQTGGAQSNPPPPVKAPPSGSQYDGTSPKISLYISGKSIQLVAFRFPCRQVKGNTSLQDIKLTKTDRGYKFGIDSYGIVTYSDSETHPDQNGAISIDGRFGRRAKTVAGHFRVKTPRCDSGRVAFDATLKA
jgi:hypothetical protein